MCNPSLQPKPMPDLSLSPTTPKVLQAYGHLIRPVDDGIPFGSSDAELSFKGGPIRFWVMTLQHRKPEVHKLTRHRNCTQCLASAEAKPWWILLAPPNPHASQPDAGAIRLFRIDPGLALKLHLGTWHAGPYFQGPTANFFNLELADTNSNDHTTAELAETIQFAMTTP